MKHIFVLLGLALLLPFASVLSAADTLDFYVLDVEGGKAMIVKTPSGQTLLLDAGMPRFNRPAPPPGAPARPAMPVQAVSDLDRVIAATKDLGIKEFDYIITTHYDVDHSGNIPAFAAQFPAKVYIDHGPFVNNPKIADINKKAGEAYLAFVADKKRMSVKPGDVIPLKDVKVTVLTSNEQVLTKAMKGAGKANKACSTKPEPVEMDDNSGSIGELWEFGKFKMADFADLLRWVEINLVCPTDMVGNVGLFMVNHHGMAASNSPELLAALAPKAVIMNNGERKGAQPDTMKVLKAAPGSPDIWLNHFSNTAGKELNPPEDFIANLAQADCQYKMIKVSAKKDGSFTITNMRNNFAKTYK